MAARYPNPRLAKIHRPYTIEEASIQLQKHKNTIREWIKEGLPLCDRGRPFLIRGIDLRAFLEVKRAECKRHCKPGEMYCFRCRAPKAPAGGMADYHPKTGDLGNLTALCQDCFTPMNQCTSLAKLERFRGILDIRVPLAQRRIDDTD